jgi:plastocyanin
MHRRATVTLACAATLAVALPATASARTKTVYEGAPPNAPAIISRGPANVDDFFMHTVTIRQGDSVKWINEDFHNVDLPGPSGKDLPVFSQGATVTGVNDASPNPFWFNGKVPSLGFNPAVLGPSGGSIYDGSKRLTSGLPHGPSKPYQVTFPKAGRYKYFCDVHPGMVGTVVVLPKTTQAPSAAADRRALARQVKTDAGEATKLAATKVTGNRALLGSAGPGGVEVFAMFPATLRVKPGTVVTFSMSKNTEEVHGATFGPATYLKNLAASFMSPAFNQAAVYPSDNPAQGPIPLSPTSHRNGFANTGLLDGDPATPLPSSGRIKFTTAGTYHYICVIHSFMKGTVIVK